MSWLNKSCLVLDKSWRAINVVPVHRAICMVFARGHIVVDSDYATYGFEEWMDRGVVDGRPVVATSATFDAPQIIVTSAVQRWFRTKVNLSKSTVCKRDDYRCQYCGRQFPEFKLSLDHVVPKSQGGKLAWENVVAACFRCNVAKGGRTPRQAGMSLLAEPREPKWSPLFAKRVRDIPPDWGKFVR